MKRIVMGLIVAALAAVMLSGCTVHVDANGFNTCRFSEERTANVPAATAKQVRIDADSGDLRVEGVAGLTEVRVRGTVCAAREEQLKSVDMRTSQSGDDILVDAIIPSVSFGNSPYLHLVVEVPESMAVRVKDDSGSINIRNVASVDVDDESGDIEISEVKGNVRVTDDSGSMVIDRVAGDVTVDRDESGDIRITRVDGGVVIDRDDSGSIDVQDVKKDVEIGSDQSGGITVRNVDGRVTVRRDDSGSIDVRDVKGDFEVGSDGSGSIHYSDVGGQVRIPSDKR